MAEVKSASFKSLLECLIFHAMPVVLNYPEEMPALNRAVVHYLFRAIIETFDYSFAVTEGRLIPNDFMDDVLIIAEEFGKMSLEEAVRLWKLESQNYVVDQKVNFFELAGEKMRENTIFSFRLREMPYV
jgi:hypothetical protein